MAEYRLSPTAEHDLEQIWIFSRNQWGVEQANRYIDALAATFVELARFPRMAPACDHIRPGYRRCHIERHMVYFRITDYGVAIIRILHDRTDARRHI